MKKRDKEDGRHDTTGDLLSISAPWQALATDTLMVGLHILECRVALRDYAPRRSFVWWLLYFGFYYLCCLKLSSVYTNEEVDLFSSSHPLRLKTLMINDLVTSS